MKNLYFSLVVFLFAGSAAFSQTVARDWTKNDCDGTEHSLYSELDNGKVIVLEYVMMNCSPCVTAAKGLKSIVASFADSHPDQVVAYSIGYSDGYTCTQMQEWRTKNSLTSSVFTGGAADVEYYGGMGMPTIVVVGGTSHKVYYSRQGYAPSHNAALKQAIEQALAEATTEVGDDSEVLPVSVYPNPANDGFTVACGNCVADRLVVVDMTGREVISQQLQPGSPVHRATTQTLAPGTYAVRLLYRGEMVHSTAIIISR